MAKNLSKVMTHEQAVFIFEHQMMPDILMIEASQSGGPDNPLRCETWNNWIDSLCKSRQISDWQFENWTPPPSCD